MPLLLPVAEARHGLRVQLRRHGPPAIEIRLRIDRGVLAATQLKTNCQRYEFSIPPARLEPPVKLLSLELAAQNSGLGLEEIRSGD